MPKEYKIETIQDMMEIPLEKFNTFLYEFAQVLTIARTVHAYNKAMGCKEPTIQKPFIWIDDGKGEIRTNITFKTKEEEKHVHNFKLRIVHPEDYDDSEGSDTFIYRCQCGKVRD